MGLLGTWVKYNQIMVIYTFVENSPTGHTCRRIVKHDGSNEADSHKDGIKRYICIHQEAP